MLALSPQDQAERQELIHRLKRLETALIEEIRAYNRGIGKREARVIEAEKALNQAIEAANAWRERISHAIEEYQDSDAYQDSDIEVSVAVEDFWAAYDRMFEEVEPVDVEMPTEIDEPYSSPAQEFETSSPVGPGAQAETADTKEA
jgi:hypothetical protein